MADYKAIADVGETLVTLLRNNMSDLISPDSIVLLSPGEVRDQNIRLTLFLYNILENPHMKNQEMRNLSSTQIGYPPLTLDLYYLLTAYASNQIANINDRSLEEAQILGRAMRVFYDNSILSGTILQGSIAGTNEELRIVLNPMSPDDFNKIWTAFQNVQYRLSISYLVTPVNIDSIRDISSQRVISKEIDHSYLVPPKNTYGD